MYNHLVMNFQKIKCHHCEENYDSQEQCCPHCQEENPSNKRTRFQNNYTSTPIWEQAVLFVLGWGGFQLIGLIVSAIVIAIERNSGGLPNDQALQEFVSSAYYSGTVNFACYTLLFFGMLIVLRNDIFKLLKTFKNWIVPIAAVGSYITILIFDNLYGMFLNLLNLGVSDNVNQSSLTTVVNAYPLISLFIFGLIGPICEELTYRVGLYTFLRRINKYLAYAITILVFTLIHFDLTVSTQAALINEFLNIPYYLVAAFVFTFVYEKFGFAASMSAHITNNAMSIIGIILLNSMQQ